MDIDPEAGDCQSDVLHHPLKRLSAILHPHRQSPELIKAPWGCDATFVSVPFINNYLVKGFSHIHLTEDLGTSNILGE